MRADSKYYLDQAEQCRRFAKRATTPDLRYQWETMAQGWLSLIPREDVPAVLSGGDFPLDYVREHQPPR